ncbi:hypothetical protein YSY43_49990 [Paenibacillus sp. YSY-4.3]
MSRKFFMSALILLMSVTLVLTGCGAKKEPKEALKSAAVTALNMDSYVSESQIKITDLKLDGSSSPEMGVVYSMLKDAELKLTQVYQKEPMQSEASLEVKLNGDFSTTITLQFVMTKDKVYVKIPSIPFLPLPEKAVGKFLEVDLKELAENSGEEFNPDLLDTDKMQKFVAEIANVVLSEYDSEKFIKDVDPKDIELPEGYKAKQVVQFYVTNDTAKEAISILLQEALPKALDIVAKDEYRAMLQLTPEDIEEAKKDLAEMDHNEFQKDLDDMQRYLTINQFNMNTAIDKDNYPSYQEMNMDVEFSDPDTKEKIKLALQMKSTVKSINEKPKFSIGIPKETMTMDEFMQEMNSLGY